MADGSTRSVPAARLCRLAKRRRCATALSKPSSSPAGHPVRLIRFRPPNALEQREGGKIVVDIDDSNTNVKLTSTSDPPGGFNYDRAFGMESTQEEIFEYGVRGIVEDVVAGYNGTVFAYGQTGSGKSFTMMVRPSLPLQEHSDWGEPADTSLSTITGRQYRRRPPERLDSAHYPADL